MKLILRFAFFFALTSGVCSLSAQELSTKSLFNMMPLSINPAYAGDFEGSFRLSGMYKDYHSSTYRTPSLSLDVPIIMIRKRDWLSAGISFDSDQAGDADFGTTRSLIGVSYHLSLDKKGESYIVAGYQFGSDSRKLDQTKLELAEDNDVIATNLGDKGQSTGINNFGLMYRSQVDKNTLLNIGVAYNYIIRQSAAIARSGGGTAGGFKRPPEFILHGLIDRNIDKKLSIHPSFIIRNRGKEGTDVMIQAMGGYLLKPDIDLRLKGGLGYDLNQGPAILLGADYGEWKFGLSFEIPLYGVAEAQTGFGGFEISASKIIKIYKKPVVDPTICCPDL